MLNSLLIAREMPNALIVLLRHLILIRIISQQITFIQILLCIGLAMHYYLIVYPTNENELKWIENVNPF